MSESGGVEDSHQSQRVGESLQSLRQLAFQLVRCPVPLALQEDGVAGCHFDADIRSATRASDFGVGIYAVGVEQFGEDGVDCLLADGFLIVLIFCHGVCGRLCFPRRVLAGLSWMNDRPYVPTCQVVGVASFVCAMGSSYGDNAIADSILVVDTMCLFKRMVLGSMPMASPSICGKWMMGKSIGCLRILDAWG